MSKQDEAPYKNAIFEAGFERDEFTHQGATRDVYRTGTGPCIIVLSELPGITPETLELCARLKSAGYSVCVPQLMGEPGRPKSLGAFAQAIGRVCVSREFTLFARRETSPITEWLRALARHEHARAGGRGVGVIGMCLTGGFALAMMVEPSVMAPVLSQPSLPFALSREHKSDLGLSSADLACAKERFRKERLKVLGLRFTADTACPADRFKRLRQELGDRFVGIEINSALGNQHGIMPWAHSVLTNDFVDRPGHPTRYAFDRVLELFGSQLREASAPA